jgi:SAM-dependent methyltransferase
MNPYDKDFWNDRFSTDGYVYGTEPSDFLRHNARYIPADSEVLLPADGEGRNSAFLASQGHTVVAGDVAPAALAKARRLAQQRGVSVDFRQLDVHQWAWPSASYDAVVGIFMQFSPPDLRARVFAGMRQAVRPDGVVLLHGYTPKQLDYGTGGPKQADFLYTEELLRDAFAGWEILRLEAYERELSEGSGHAGMSALIDLVARRPGTEPSVS